MPKVIYTAERIASAYEKLNIDPAQLLQTAKTFARSFRKLDLPSALDDIVVRLAEEDASRSFLTQTQPLTLLAIAKAKNGIISPQLVRAITMESEKSQSFPVIFDELAGVNAQTFRDVARISLLGDRGYAEAIALKVVVDVISHMMPLNPMQQFIEHKGILARVERGLSERPGFAVAIDAFLEKHDLSG